MKRRILALAVMLASLQALTPGSALAIAFAPPSFITDFSAASIPVGGHTRINFKIGNTNTGYKLDQVAFTDTLPSGLVIGTPNNLSGDCLSHSGVAIIAQAGTRYIKVTNLFFDTVGSCAISIDVTGVAVGTQLNTTSTITGCVYCTDPLLTGPAVSASIVVVAAPTPTRAPTRAPTPAPTPVATPSETPAASEAASESPGETVAASASATAAVVESPSPVPSPPPAPADGGSNGLIFVALGGIVAVGLAGLLIALFIRRRRQEK